MVATRVAVVALVWMSAMPLQAQVNRYMVFFEDKASSAYSTSEPLEFLSQRAVDRRLRQGIAVTEQDLPVNETYVQGLRAAGAGVYYRTRWMNGALVQCEATVAAALQELEYVSSVTLVAPGSKLQGNGRKRYNARTRSGSGNLTDTQLGMVGIDRMHVAGFRGEGMSVALFDVGFPGVNTAAPFQHIFAEGRLNTDVSHDFVYNTDNVFQYDKHGTQVFSVIAAYDEGAFTGGAYEATYQLYVTEDVTSEYRIEEYNWLFAAERADSAGVDVVNASLGYYGFDNESMDYPKSALDGNTAIVTRAAQWAAERGMAIIVSAGNEGNNAWQTITPPADARDVLAVGAVTPAEEYVNFSSKGPSADGRVKPDVAAMGAVTNAIFPDGSPGTVSGTSLAAPIITSLVTGLWQEYPYLTNRELLDVIRRSGSQASNPDAFLGYGIPHYERVKQHIAALQENPFAIYPNPVTDDTIFIKPWSTAEVSSCILELVSELGQTISTTRAEFSHQSPTASVDLSAQPPGLYLLRIQWNGRAQVFKILNP